MKQLNLDAVNFIRLRIEKHIDSKSSIYPDMIELCDNVIRLLLQTLELKTQLLDSDLNVTPEKNWENILTAKLGHAIQSNEKEYLELTNSINNDIFVITIQKKFGKTPKQLLDQSEIRRFKAVKKLVNLVRDCKQMREKLARQDKELAVLTTVRMGSPEEELKTKEDIQLAIDKLNDIIKKYNNATFRRELNKVSESLRKSYFEAWGRASTSDYKVAELSKKNRQLEMEILKKKYPPSRFSMYRKKGEIRNHNSKKSLRP